MVVERRATVLVVDDEPAIIELMRDFLEVEGFGVVTARDGAEALEILARTTVDCLLLDVMMPGQSGFDLCRQARQRHDLQNLLSATATARRFAATAAAGMTMWSRRRSRGGMIARDGGKLAGIRTVFG